MSVAVEAKDISIKLREFIVKNLLFSASGYEFDDNVSFLDEGIIDSLGIIELVSFVESQYGVSVADRDLVPDNFDSIAKLTAYIGRKLEAKA